MGSRNRLFAYFCPTVYQTDAIALAGVAGEEVADSLSEDVGEEHLTEFEGYRKEYEN